MMERVNEQELKAGFVGSTTSLPHVVDEVQDLLEGVYGLANLRLQRASNFLYPRKHSAVLRHNFEIGDATGTNFSTDWDIPIGRWKDSIVTGTDWIREQRRERLMVRFNPRRILHGRLYFQDLNPVIYVSPEHAKDTEGITILDQMLIDQRIESLELITMAVSMFMNANTQYNLHQEMPRPIPAYGMTLVDFYHVVIDISSRANIDITQLGSDTGGVGRLQLMKTVFARQGLESEAFKRSIKAAKRGQIYLNPLAEQYTQSTDIFEGFLYYLIENADSEADMSSELKDFYCLKGEDKKIYLMDLYRQKVEGGDERYRRSWKKLGYLESYDRGLNWAHKDSRYE